MSLSLSLWNVFFVLVPILSVYSHTHIHTRAAFAFGMHSKSWQYKSHGVRPVAWHWKLLCWALKTDGNQCCNYVQLFVCVCVCVLVCVRVCVLNLAVDLSLLFCPQQRPLVPHTWSFCRLLVSGTTGRKMYCIILGWRCNCLCVPRVPLRSWPTQASCVQRQRQVAHSVLHLNRNESICCCRCSETGTARKCER